ncbi:MAG: hypothetical protein JRJ43_11635 [Deltaproteobacteria bacterium]|nr:hypothetical protein [Deltaproteobacteria bacterium]MBW1720186.1 hypothetical protein [Deltaproteobacteria bacterium]MBW2351333.1 hypothetical protein [Deltaproteobacteria bacterium]
MKKVGTIIAGISLSLILLVAGAWAADIVLEDTGSGPDLTYSMSPNVDMNYTNDSTADTHIITSSNSKGTMAYGIVNTYSGYYQVTIAVGADCPAATQATIDGMTEFGAS